MRNPLVSCLCCFQPSTNKPWLPSFLDARTLTAHGAYSCNGLLCGIGGREWFQPFGRKGQSSDWICQMLEDVQSRSALLLGRHRLGSLEFQLDVDFPNIRTSFFAWEESVLQQFFSRIKLTRLF